MLLSLTHPQILKSQWKWRHLHFPPATHCTYCILVHCASSTVTLFWDSFLRWMEFYILVRKIKRRSQRKLRMILSTRTSVGTDCKRLEIVRFIVLRFKIRCCMFLCKFRHEQSILKVQKVGYPKNCVLVFTKSQRSRKSFKKLNSSTSYIYNIKNSALLTFFRLL